MTAFGELVDSFLEREFENSPVSASALGLTEYDARMDDLSAEAFRLRDAHAREWRGRFEEIEAARLAPGEQIDRDLVVAMLSGRLILADWESWKRDPLVYSGPILQGILNLFIHRLRPEEELVDAAVARLNEAPRVLDEGRENLDPALAHPLIVERALASARAGARYVREILPRDVSEGAVRERLTGAGARAGEAFDRWAEHLERLQAEATGEWRLGEERYTALLQRRESLPYDARWLRDRGRAEYDRLDREMREISQELRGTDDWRAVLEEANEDHPATEEAMRVSYEEWTQRSRAFLAETGLVTLPDGEQCSVEPSPVFQRPVIGVASYLAPPAFADTLLGHFFVPFAPDGAPPEEVQKRLAANSHGGIPTTAVHETYPGHHWHLVMRKTAGGGRVRKVFSTPYFSEGWALYAERVMRERGFFSDRLQELYHLEATIFRAARIIVDTSLHLGEMSYEAAVTFMTTKVPLPEPTARAEVGRYCWWPTQASAYLTGCLEILDIRERYLAARGLGAAAAGEVPVEVLRDFHDRLAASGSLPLGLAARAVLEEAPAGG